MKFSNDIWSEDLISRLEEKVKREVLYPRDVERERMMRSR